MERISLNSSTLLFTTSKLRMAFFIGIMVLAIPYISHGQMFVSNTLFNKSSTQNPELSNDEVKSKIKAVVQSVLGINKELPGIIDTVSLKNHIATWEKSLEKPQDIDPYLAHYEAKIINCIAKELGRIQANRRAEYATDSKPHMSSQYTAGLKQLADYQTQLKSLSRRYKAINSIMGKPRVGAKFAPARNKFGAELLYNHYGRSSFQFGQHVSFYGWDNKGSISPEVVSFYAGPVRIGLNTLVAATDRIDSTAVSLTALAKLKTLTGNGGNIVLNGYYPLFHYSNAYNHVFVQTTVNGAIEAPILGSPFEPGSLNANINIGFDIEYNVKIALTEKSSLYFHARPNYIVGTKPYMEYLGLTDQSGFLLMQTYAGLELPNLGRLGLSLPPITSVASLRSNAWMVSLHLSTKSFGQ